MHPIFSEIEKKEKDYGRLEKTFMQLEKQGTDLLKKKDLVEQDNKLMKSDSSYLQQMAERLTENYEFIKKENLENSIRQKKILAEKKRTFQELSALLSKRIETSLLGDQKNVDTKQLLRYERLIKENLKLHEQNIDLRSQDHILAPLGKKNVDLNRDTNRKTLSINSGGKMNVDDRQCSVVRGDRSSINTYYYQNSGRISKIPTLDQSIENPGRYKSTGTTSKEKKKKGKKKKSKKEKCSLI